MGPSQTLKDEDIKDEGQGPEPLRLNYSFGLANPMIFPFLSFFPPSPSHGAKP